MSHIPIMVNEVLSILSPKNGERFIDATFGGGGHTTAILNFCPDVSVVGIDRDPDAIKRADIVEGHFNGRFKFISGKFSELESLIKDIGKFDGILLDFGLSSFQLDTPERGFAFSKDGPLDMRMSKDGMSAAELVNTFEEEQIAQIIKVYGDEPKFKSIASAIVRARKLKPIETTQELKKIINEALNFEFKKKQFSKIDSSTLTFQALRIYINDELREIDIVLNSLSNILRNNARIATISFHALEDRIVKNWSKNNCQLFKRINKKVITPSRAEILSNPRSRSAVLRGFIFNGLEL